MKDYKGINKIKAILEIGKEAGEPILLVGKHGIGKTETVEQFAKENGYFFKPLYLSHQETADLIGIPVEKDGVTIWSKPEWVHEIEEAAKQGKDTILFLDELNRAPLDVRQVALQLVLNKEVHTHKLPENTYIVAAINPVDDDVNNYQVEDLDKALLDRFFVVNVEPNANDWLEWAMNNGIHPIITKFISKFPEYLYYEDENLDVYPTNRAWAKLSKVLKSYENKFRNEQSAYPLLVELVNGKIGPVVGQKFLTFYQNEKIFNLDDLLNAASVFENNVMNPKDIDYIFNKIVEFNDFDSEIDEDEVFNDPKIVKYFKEIEKLAEKLKKEKNIETAEVHYIYQKLLPEFLKNVRKYYVPMTLLLYIANKEVIVSFIKQLGKDIDAKTKLGYTIPFIADEIYRIVKGLDEESE